MARATTLKIIRQVDVDLAFNVLDEITQADLDKVFPPDRDWTPEEEHLFSELMGERGERRAASARYGSLSQFYAKLEIASVDVTFTEGAETPIAPT